MDRRAVSLCAAAFCAAVLCAQEEEPEEEIFTLPEVAVTETYSAETPRPESPGETITREQMEREGSHDLWEAVRTIPGVVRSGGGARNDSSFTVRGFDSASMPVFVDGVPVANPYRGDNDAARILTGDLDSVTIEKGFGGMLLGANTMGGAITMRTAKPKKPFEASFSSGFGFDVLGKFADTTETASIGGKGSLFYGKGTFQFRGVDHFRIPYAFEPIQGNPQERGDRLWSDSNDIKITLIAGLTPLKNMDYTLTWIYQDSNKGFSPPAVKAKDFQIWEWPYYDRQSISLQGEWTPAPFSLHGLIYYSKFQNRMVDYGSWANYLVGMHNPYSDYDDYSWGARVQGGWDITSRNRVNAAVNFKEDDHKGLTGETLGVHITEDTWSLGSEYIFTFWEPLRFMAGIGLDAVVPRAFWGQRNQILEEAGRDALVKTEPRALFAAEAGVFYTIAEGHELHLTYARKNHFPTMSQRYSTRYGEQTPNPDLGPEYADHIELGYRLLLGDRYRLNTAAYFSNVTGKIVEMRVPNPQNTAVTVGYTVNLDNTAMWGFELGFEIVPLSFATLGGTFAWNRYSIIRSELAVETLSYYPEITAGAYAVIRPILSLSLIPSVEYTGSRYADTTGGSLLDGYLLVNLKGEFVLSEYCTLSGGIDNIFDVLYEIRQYFPQPGRSYYFTINLKY